MIPYFDGFDVVGHRVSGAISFIAPLVLTDVAILEGFSE